MLHRLFSCRRLIAALLWALAVPWAMAASLCETGLRQSPIDITAAHKAALPRLQFDYAPAALRIANDGHTARVRLQQAGRLQIGPQSFALQQVHFHTPGGDRIHGEAFPMAAHLLHKGGDGQLLSVVVLLRLGAPNRLLDTVLPHIPARVGDDHRPAKQTVDVRQLLPASLGYYRYSGSLTSAPCTEGVQWIVLKQPATLSAAQLALWQRRFADNARAPQPLHGRQVQESD